MSHVLVVDDETVILTVLSKFLRTPSRQITVATTAEEALTFARAVPFDVALVDKNLGPSSGLELIKALRAIQPDLEVILMTGYASLESAIDALQLGVFDYLRKPFEDPAALSLKVESAAEKGRLRKTERLLSQALADNEERYRRVFEAATDAIFVVDANTLRVQEANPAALRLLGCDSATELELASRGLTRGVLEASPTSLQPVRIVPVNGQEVLAEVTVGEFTHTGRRPRKMKVVAVRDVTERERSIQHRDRLEGQLRHAQKMDAIGRLASGVAHDFNNVLAAILCHTEYLMAAHGEGETAEDVDGILQASKRGVALTRQLLMFARNKPIELQVLDLNQVVADMSRLFRRTTEEQVELKVGLSEAAPRVKADADQLGQVLLNLVVNARDAMPQGGRLHLSTSQEVVSPERATPDLPAGQYAVLTVRDEGVGMTPEVRARMFEPFFTTKEVGKGTGLGLATVYAIIKQLGGAVRVESEPDQGTRVDVLIPRCEAGLLPEAPSSPLEVKGGRNETVLLVEDEEVLRALLARMLADNGYRVLSAADGEKALALSREHAGRIDLLLTDVVMPRVSGRQLAEQLTRERPDVKTLYMSGHIDQQIVRDGLLDGSLGFLQKPFAPRALLALMRKVLDPDEPAGVSRADAPAASREPAGRL